MVWEYAIGSVILVSLISLIGVITLSIKKQFMNSILFLLVSFAAGALLGDAFIHLLPQLVEEYGFGLNVSLYVLLGMMIFFVLEKFLHWHHCHHTHEGHKHSHHLEPLAVNNLISDGFHNFLDGLIIAGSYLVSVPVGVATTIAVILHEIPQEIGDFGILIFSGFSRSKALFFNFLSSLTAMAGAIVGLLIGTSVEHFALFLIPITAGHFIYIATADIIPELHKETRIGKSILQFIGLLVGIAIMMLLLLLE